MTKNKEQYCSPNTKVLVVRFEGCILQGSPYGAKGAAGGTMSINNLGENDEDLY